MKFVVFDVMQSERHENGTAESFYGRITISRAPTMSLRYLYSQDGEIIGYMDRRDKYLYSQDGDAIAYWDSSHKYMYTLDGDVYGYLASNGRYLYSQSGGTVGYFHPPYGTA